MYKCKNISQKISEFLVMLLIRYIYMASSYMYLNNLYYAGGSYGIDFNYGKELISIFAFLVINYVYVNRTVEGVFSNFLLTTLHVVYFIPMSCTYSLNNTKVNYYLLVTLYCILSEIAIGTCSKSSMSFTPQKNAISHISTQEIYVPQFDFLDILQVRVFCFISCLVLIIYKFFYNGFDINLSLIGDDIYTNRGIFSNMLYATEGSLLSYFITIVTNISSFLTPIYLLVSLKKKRTIDTIISIATILSLYSLNSQKGNLFMIPIVFFIFLCSKYNKIEMVGIGFKYGILLSLAYTIITLGAFDHRSILFEVLFRRVMYIPAWLNTLYYKFFEINPKVLWSQNTFLLQRIIPDVYGQSPITVISNYYFNGIIPTPNTGMFADAYMNIGIIGVIVYPIIYRAIFLSSQKVYSKYGTEVELLVAANVTLTITNINILRSNFILSFVLITVVLWLLPKLKLGRSLMN